MKRNLWLDGTTPDGCYHGFERGYSDRAPYAVFDADTQDWLASEIRFRWVARLIKWWHGGGW